MEFQDKYPLENEIFDYVDHAVEHLIENDKQHINECTKKSVQEKISK